MKRNYGLLLLSSIVACGSAHENGPASGDASESSDAGSDETAATADSADVDAASGGSGSTSSADDSDASSSSDDTGGAIGVELGSAGGFAMLAKSAISNVPQSAITGDIGLSPSAASFITGFSLVADATSSFSTSAQVTGRVFAADYAAPTPAAMTTAISDMELAFTEAASRAPDVTELGAGEIGGMTLEPGVYKWGTGLLVTTDVTLSGSATDLWIFQIAGDLTVGNGAAVVLAGGARPENVVWQVAGLVELGTTSHCEGIVLTQTSITLRTGASVVGRLMAQTAIGLDGNTIVEPSE